MIFIADGKGTSAIAVFAEFLQRHGGDPAAFTDVTGDMSEAFLAGIKRHLPNARITLDRFHIVKLIGDAVDHVRRRERHEQLIVNWTTSHISNGILEGNHSILQAMKSSARGYRTIEFITTVGYLIGLKPKEGFHHK